MKRVLKWIRNILLAVIGLAVIGLGYLTVTEFSPEPVEPAEKTGTAEKTLVPGQELELVSWNIGYGGLGAASDFFMDGGSSVRAADEATVRQYLEGIRSYLESEPCDLVLLQEVDEDSTRTFGIDEREVLAPAGRPVCTAFAKNFSVPFVPYPMPPIGHVESGLLTFSAYTVESADRVALPCPFSWPMRIANLKRCLLAERLPVEGTDRELVLVNLHLEAYDSGEGKIAQTRQLVEFIEGEYQKGNYVIVGGDFNQSAPGGVEAWPNTHEDLWTPGLLEEAALPQGFSYAFDLLVPTCRLLNQPYDPADTQGTQYYVIDGYILSPNVTLRRVETVDLGFEYSDHNPVRLDVVLQ